MSEKYRKIILKSLQYKLLNYKIEVVCLILNIVQTLLETKRIIF